jgi:hypothetical protein
MKAHEFISMLDDARYGHRQVAEDKEAVGDSPSHAPTSTAQWKTPSSGKSKDEGERNGGEKDAIKKSDSSIPAPVAKAPSHAPTSTAQWKTKKEVHSDDEGEKISKEAMKENLLDDLLDAESLGDVQAVLSQAALGEGGHKDGCQCGFCKNKGSFGKKKEDKEKNDDDKGDDKDMSEGLPMRPGAGAGAGLRKPMGGRMGFRHPARPGAPRPGSPRPKAAMAPYQPSMEQLDTTNSPTNAIREMADDLLEAPE